MSVSATCDKCHRGISSSEAIYCTDCHFRLINRLRKLEKRIKELEGKK
jgi:DNA-directed RNA polymerase subunit RPC12/RpoP